MRLPSSPLPGDGAGSVPMNPECLVCRAMGRACQAERTLAARPGLLECAGELACQRGTLEGRERCYACDGSGKVRDEGRQRWHACQACNAPPPYPGLVPGGVAEQAYRAVMARGPRGRRPVVVWRRPEPEAEAAEELLEPDDG